MHRPRSLLFVAALGCWAVVLGSLHADERHADKPSAADLKPVSPYGWQTIRLDELREPPPELGGVLARGEITFLVGGLRPSLLETERFTGAKDRNFAAETRFQLNYSFKSHCRWQWAEGPVTRRLRIAVRFDQLQLVARHRVWLREMPERESFWDSPLVRHELDHVQLSSDPRLAAMFVNSVAQHQEIELTRQESAPLIAQANRRKDDAGQGSESVAGRDGSILNRLSGEDAQPFLDALVQEEFDRIAQLVEIRYQELDQQTDHGRQLVPEKSPLSEWLGR